MDAVATIIALIGKKGITEQKFLSDLGFNRSLLSDWKSGKSKSYKKHIDNIADYFDVSTDYLLGKTSIKKTPPGEAEELNGLDAMSLRVLKIYNALDDANKLKMFAELEELYRDLQKSEDD